jgi:hypothetical protein
MLAAININGCVLVCWCWLQFLYDASGVGSPTGAWLCVTLGLWHPYKQANSVVWSHWGPRFLAPLLHHFAPGANFSGGARLITIITYFTYIRLAAPSFAKQLQDAIKAARADRARPLALAYLLDLRCLVFFCIPVVTSLHLVCRRCCLGVAVSLHRVCCSHSVH